MRRLPLVALALILAAFLPAAHAISPALYPNIPYDAAKDFIMKEFIAYAKAEAEKYARLVKASGAGVD